MFQAEISREEVEIPSTVRFSGISAKIRSRLECAFFFMILGRVRPIPTYTSNDEKIKITDHQEVDE